MKVTQIYRLGRVTVAARLSRRQSALQCGRRAAASCPGSPPDHLGSGRWRRGGGCCTDFRGHKCPSEPPFRPGFAEQLLFPYQPGHGSPKHCPGTCLRLQVTPGAAGRRSRAPGRQPPLPLTGLREAHPSWGVGSPDSVSVPWIRPPSSTPWDQRLIVSASEAGQGCPASCPSYLAKRPKTSICLLKE